MKSAINPKRKFNFSFHAIARPMGWMLALSILYNIALIYGSVFLGGSILSYVLLVVLSMASSIGFYWIFLNAVMDKPKIQKEALLPILVVQGILIILILVILSPLHAFIYEADQWYFSLPYQIICAVLVVLMQPLQLSMFASLAKGITKPKEILHALKEEWKSTFKNIWNRYCLILLMMIFLDSIVGGMFSFASGFDAFTILSGVFFYGNPMFSWMFAFMMAAGIGLKSSMIYYLILLFFVGVVYLIVECQYLKKIKETWFTDGTQKYKAHKKKK